MQTILNLYLSPKALYPTPTPFTPRGDPASWSGRKWKPWDMVSSSSPSFQYFPPFLSFFLFNAHLSTCAPDPTLSCFFHQLLHPSAHQLFLLSSVLSSSPSISHFLSDQILKQRPFHPSHFVNNHPFSTPLCYQTSWTQSHSFHFTSDIASLHFLSCFT